LALRPRGESCWIQVQAALPDDCLIWHNIDLPNHYQPDIVAYLPRFGVIIFEVKDWVKRSHPLEDIESVQR